MSEIDAIKNRHSVKNYEIKKIEAEMADKIRAKIDELKKREICICNSWKIPERPIISS